MQFIRDQFERTSMAGLMSAAAFGFLFVSIIRVCITKQ